MKSKSIIFLGIFCAPLFSQMIQPSSVADNGGGITTGGTYTNASSVGQPVICMASGGGNTNCAGFLGSIMGTSTKIFEQPNKGELPQKFFVNPPTPNPFNSNVSFDMEFPRNGALEMRFFDISGKIIFSENKEVVAGRYRAIFSGDILSSGIYFYRISFENEVFSGRIILLK